MGQFSDDLFLGPAITNIGMALNDPAPMSQGLGPMGRVLVYDIVPLALNLSGLAVAQAVGAAGYLTLAAGTRVTAVVDGNGVTRYTLDVPRCVDFLSSNNGDTTQTALVTGYDVYGQPMTQLVTLNGTTRAATTKAFKSVVTVYISALTAGNISMGTTDVLGLPVVVATRDYINFNYNATVGALSVVTVADATSPATNATGDVRGTIALASASDGTKRLVATIACSTAMCGPQATVLAALGVANA